MRGNDNPRVSASENREHPESDAGTLAHSDGWTEHNMNTFVFNREQMPTPCGELHILTDEEGALRALDWCDHELRMSRLLRLHYGQDAVQLKDRHSPSQVRRALEAYLAGELEALDPVTVRTGGTTFQRQVWAALRNIPAGRTLSYGALAAQLNRPGSVRAVGMANGANPVCIVVACHRVIGADGSLTGYGGGLARKRWLLEHEHTYASASVSRRRDKNAFSAALSLRAIAAS
jgi:methylated-DNA-[protein]-cysteine S-methyltransferase